MSPDKNLGVNTRSADSKLRMLLHGDSDVNSRRAEYSGAVRISAEAAGHRDIAWQKRAYAQVSQRVSHEERPPTASAAPDDSGSARVGRPRGGASRPRADAGRDADAVSFSVFMDLSDRLEHADEGPACLGGALSPSAVTARRDRMWSAQVTRNELLELIGNEDVPWVEAAQDLRQPTARIGAALDERPPVARSSLVSPFPSGVAPDEDCERREKVLIGLIDVGGFDFAHPDFLHERASEDDAPRTRFVAIWDQGGGLRGPPLDPRTGETTPMFDYGSVIGAKHMDAALAAAHGGAGAPAWRLEPQSVMRAGSHGTHVASIAAGNGGVCPDALIAGVVVDIPELRDSRLSFYDTSRIVHAVEWLAALAETENAALSINVSLATNGHAHDASSAGSRWLDAILATPGRAICVAAGNSGQESPTTDGDLGWMMGRIHAEGRIPGRDLTHELEWLVIGNGAEDMSENELEIWYGAQDRISVRIRTPDGRWFPPFEGPDGPIEPGVQLINEPVEFEIRDPRSGQTVRRRSFVTITNDTYHRANGANRIAIYLSPDLKQIHGVMPGRWLVRLYGDRIRDGSFHAWIERDDPGRMTLGGTHRVTRFPSFFSEKSNSDRSSVSSLACGHRVISVANLDPANDRIHPSSSQGPTRDGRPKPEVAAPGTAIVAARGFASRTRPWVEMTGTSMASPYVCGVAARMLQVNPQLTAAQIGSIMRATARPLPSADYSWRDDAGYGVIDPAACLEEARLVAPPRRVKL